MGKGKRSIKLISDFEFNRTALIDRGRFSEVKRCYDTTKGADQTKKHCIKIIDKTMVDKIYSHNFIKHEMVN